ncbi:MAG TPA: tRNA glutamyl-Q(34) synthetase GluQRS [Sphingomicrobium sp.]|jgi:glutamyl-Q tRNA(Asp) synthetase|nr:tRNA glutamyl-Q(34) synthetase GluQRS [Sphingomicrobium sp.]
MIATRFAPSPTGRLHLGHAYSAALANRSGDRFLLRIEDLDQTRSRPEFIAGIEEDLRWLRLEPDGEALIQSQRSAVYNDALERLKEEGLVYPCFCTRSDIAAALNAPHGPAQSHYPGTCRDLPDDPKRRASIPHSWRLDAAKAIERVGFPTWTEADGRRLNASAADIDDEILARKDAPASYHLACVVDDAATGANLVVRGMDLRSSTPVQRLLQMLLGLPEPTYFHHELVVHDDGRRLAKRDLAPTLAAMRESGVDGRSLAGRLLDGVLPAGFRLAQA